MRPEATQRRGARAAQRAEAVREARHDDEAEEKLEDLDDSDRQVALVAVDLLGTLLRTHGAKFSRPFAALVAPELEKWADPRCAHHDRLCALLLVCDVLEFCGDAWSGLWEAVAKASLRRCG